MARFWVRGCWPLTGMEKFWLREVKTARLESGEREESKVGGYRDCMHRTV